MKQALHHLLATSSAAAVVATNAPFLSSALILFSRNDAVRPMTAFRRSCSSCFFASQHASFVPLQTHPPTKTRRVYDGASIWNKCTGRTGDVRRILQRRRMYGGGSDSDNGGWDEPHGFDEEDSAVSEFSSVEIVFDGEDHSGETTLDDNEGGGAVAIASAEDDDNSPSVDDDDDDGEENPSIVLHAALVSAVDKALNRLNRKSKSLRSELDKAQRAESTMKRANLIISNLYRLPPGTESATVEDWDNDGNPVELVLDTESYGTAQEEADALFAMARKMRRGSGVVRELLEKNDDAERALGEAREELNRAIVEEVGRVDEGRVELVRERLERSAKRTGFRMPSAEGSATDRPRGASAKSSSSGRRSTGKKAPTYRRLASPFSGLPVLVGKSRRDNEAISFQVARGDDVWFHARGVPGAHVLLQVRRGRTAEPTEDCFQFAADLAAFYSDARTERRAAVTAAEPKHILKPRGAPLGAVKLRKELRTLVGRPDRVPEELKEARGQSGLGGDESGSRSFGVKAKNRSRQVRVSKENQAKRRMEKREKRRRRRGGGDVDKGTAGEGE